MRGSLTDTEGEWPIGIGTFDYGAGEGDSSEFWAVFISLNVVCGNFLDTVGWEPTDVSA